MNTNASSSATGTGWQVLGELKLTANSGTDPMVGTWLSVILSPLELRADFLNKVLKSAQEATVHALQVDPVVQFKQVYVLIFIAADHSLNGQNWGFFRIEKVENTNGQDFPNHAIEFYLYQEGQSDRC